MKLENHKNFRHLIISFDSSLLDALKLMDKHFVKLLLVFKDDKYSGLLSIGDIQRYFLKNQSFDAPVELAQRENQKVAYQGMSENEITDMIISFRTEFMPILSEDGALIDVQFYNSEFYNNQAIERKSLKDIPVVIMAGGEGTRLKPITNIIPKPLIPLGDKPIVERIMDSLYDYGCNDFHISTNYKKEMLQSYIENNMTKEYSINLFSEDKPLGTAGSLSLIRNKITSTFIVTNCDIIIEDDYNAILDYHKSSGNELTMVAAVKLLEIPYGTLEVDENSLLKNMNEKPKFDILVNAGFYILEPHLLDEIPEDEFYHITYLIEKLYKSNRKVGVFPVKESSWLDIGQWKQYQSSLKRFGSQIDFEK